MLEQPETLENTPTESCMRKNHTLRQLIDSVAPLPIDILIEAETGAGKDTIAKTLHRLSGRKGDFIYVNCAAIPESLAESELFGVTVGAFTGAERSRSGYIERAHEGTLYLDEIDSMPLSLQVKLLHLLENRKVKRLGSSDFTSVDMRVITSTKAPLADLVKEGTFREDLLYRLSVIVIKLLPLRSSPETIIHLFKHFLNKETKRFNKSCPTISQELFHALISHRWPGNIRELKAAATRHILGLPIFPDLDIEETKNTNSLRNSMNEVERALIQESLNRHNGNISEVVNELNIPRRTLYHRMKLLDLSYNANTTNPA